MSSPIVIAALPTQRLDEIVSAKGLCGLGDPEAYFPFEPSTLGDLGPAREYAASLCAGCPAKAECLELALRIPAGRYGVWGGTTATDRVLMRRRRAQQRLAGAT